MIDPRSIEAFWWVVQLGGFGRAAERLHTTQPSISARIAALEATLGARLLERGQRRRPSLTPQGMQLLGYAERLIALQAEMHAAFRPGAGLQGTVRLGVAETIVHTWLGTLVRRLHEAHPALEVDITVDISPALRTALLAGEVDVALLLGPVAAPRISDAPLCDFALAWVARAGAFEGQVGAAQLAATPIVTYARQTAPWRQVRDALDATRPAQPARVFANASLASIVRMVQDGIGVGVIAPAAIRAELGSGALVLLETDLPLDPLRFTASWREGPGAAIAATVAREAQAVAAEYDQET